MAHILLLLTAPLWAALSVFSAKQTAKLLRLRRTGERAPGTVVSVQSERDDGAGVREVRFRFETREGRVMETSPSGKSAFNRLRSGQSITVAYDPADPLNAEIIDSKAQLVSYVFVALAAALACVLSVLGGLNIIEGAGDRY
ncbi:hypothetical protein GCM10027570_46050 [Streptomonospora sediminis]